MVVRSGQKTGEEPGLQRPLGTGGGGMAQGASVGRHSTKMRRVDASRRSCSRMTVGRYTASKVTSCHIEVWKLSPVLKMCPRYDEISAPPVYSSTFIAISSAYFATDSLTSVMMSGISAWSGSSLASASASGIPLSSHAAGAGCTLESRVLFSARARS